MKGDGARAVRPTHVHLQVLLDVPRGSHSKGRKKARARTRAMRETHLAGEETPPVRSGEGGSDARPDAGHSHPLEARRNSPLRSWPCPSCFDRSDASVSVLEMRALGSSNEHRKGRWDEEEESFYPVEIEASGAAAADEKGWWSYVRENSGKRSTKCVLWMVLAVVMAGIVALAWPANNTADNGHENSTKATDGDGVDTCLTPGCVQLSARLMDAVDVQEDPCEDFFQYACGKWNEENPIPADRSRWNTFSVLNQRTEQQLKTLLDGNAKGGKDVEAVDKAKRMYRSCMDLDAIQERGDKHALEQFQSWKLALEEDPWGWDSDIGADWFTKVVGEMDQAGIHPFFVTAVEADEKDSSKYTIYMDQAGLVLPSREYYLDKDPNEDPILLSYQKYIKDTMALALQGDAEEDFLQAQANDIIELESKMAKIFLPKDELRDPEKSYNYKSLEALADLFPSLSWSSLFAWSPSNFEVSGVIVGEPSYFSGLAKLFEDSPPSQIRNYMRWNAFSVLAPMLRQEYKDTRFALEKVLYGLDLPAPRWMTCVSVVDRVLGFALGRLYVDRRFNVDAADAAEDMVHRIKNAFISSLKQMDWLDNGTVALAEEKAESMHAKIAFPRWILQNEELNSYYSQLEVSEDYFKNMLMAQKAEHVREWSRLGTPVDHGIWDMTPSTVNAYYNPLENEIVFPAAILQPPFFSPGYSSAANFGGIGAVVGHELTHGFDDQGRQFDKNGNLKPWWPQDAINTFDEKATCIVKQYSSYTIEGEHINGQLTLGENIADNGGLDSSFHAYREWVATVLENGEEKALPGVQFTPNQVFFLSYAQTWCGSSTPAAAKESLLTDPHSPARARVNGPISNSKEFSDAFQCKTDSLMNPARKCKVWQ